MLTQNNPEENKIQELFVDYIQKARAVYPPDVHSTAVDSDISVMAHSLLALFDKERE